MRERNQCVILDDCLPPEWIRDAATFWPAADCPAWVKYDSAIERKQTLHDWRHIPGPCKLLLRCLLAWDLGLYGFPPGTPDTLLHGAGLHQHGPGEHLGGHLDADRHPLTGMERLANGLLFLDDWEEEWGGALELWSADRRRCLTRILPERGRLVLFRTTDTSYHRVAPITCPAGLCRRSLAVYWWAHPHPDEPVRRPRAQFVHLGPGPADPTEERLRAERSG